MRTVSTDHLTDQELLRLVEGLAFGEGMPIEVQQALVRRFGNLLRIAAKLLHTANK